MESKAWKYATFGLGILLLIAIVVAVWFFVSNRGAVIVDGSTDGSALLDEQPSFVLAGERDGNGRILLIPSGRQANVGCEADDEVLVLNIPVGGSGNRGILLCVEPDPTATPSPTEEPTSTAVPPTPTNDPEPTATATAVTGDPIEPYADAPPCGDLPPNDTYHSLWNATVGCYYTKTHGDDPRELDWLLGPLDDYLDAEISYPWQTVNAAGITENEAKHDFYKWYVADFGRGYCNMSRPVAELCIEAIRIQFHAIEDAPGVTTQIHSFWANGYACNAQGDCGVFATGGHSDFAEGVMCPYKRTFCGLIGGTVDTLSLQPPYTAMDVSGSFPRAQWNSGSNANPTPPNAYNQSFSMDWVGRAWAPLNAAAAPFVAGDPTLSYCYDDASGNADGVACTQNGLAVRPYEFIFQAHGLSGDVDLFTDVRGRLDSDCTETSAECIPFILRDWPGGDAGLRDADVGTSTGFITQDELYHEFDILFDGESSGWAEWPN